MQQAKLAHIVTWRSCFSQCYDIRQKEGIDETQQHANPARYAQGVFFKHTAVIEISFRNHEKKMMSRASS